MSLSEPFSNYEVKGFRHTSLTTSYCQLMQSQRRTLSEIYHDAIRNISCNGEGIESHCIASTDPQMMAKLEFQLQGHVRKPPSDFIDVETLNLSAELKE
jgi:predicted component of type VI protein secretion system